MINLTKINEGLKLLLTIMVIAVIIFVGIKMFGYFDKKTQLVDEQIVIIKENLISQRIEIDNGLLKERMEQINESIIELAKKRDQDITDIGHIVTRLEHQISESAGNSYHDVESDGKKDYVETVIKQKDTEGKEYPVAWAMYSPNIDEEEKWTTGAYPLEFHTQIVLGENDDRSDAYVNTWVTSDIFNEDKDVKFPITINNVEWVKGVPKEKEFFYNPRLSLGFSFGEEIYPNLGLSFWSYGRTKGDMDWRFLTLGFGFNNDDFFIQAAPFEYNIGKPLPLVDNIFLYPFINFNTDFEYGFGGGIGLPL